MTIRSLLLSLAVPAALSAQTVVRVNVTPSPARVVAGESLRLKAEPVDKDGKPVNGVLALFEQQDFPFQAHPQQVVVWKTARSDAGRMLHDIDVRDGMVYGRHWNDGLVTLDIGSRINGGSPSNPQLVSQYKYDLDALYKPVEAVGGPGFIRGTHTAWRHDKYVFIADDVFTMKDIMALETKGASRACGRLRVLDVFPVSSAATSALSNERSPT